MTPLAKQKNVDGMKFSLLFFASGEDPFSEDKYRLLIESAKFADQHGFSSVWIPERHFTQAGCLYPNPVVVHAALARETKQIHLRAGSVVLPLHNPIRVAEDWAIVDNLSRGRIGISFAPGWHPNDFVFSPEKYADRHEEMYRSIQTVQKLWQGELIQIKNGNGDLTEVKISPTPIQHNLPIWITAASNPNTFNKAGEIGANLLTHLFNQSIEEVAEKIDIYRQSLAKNGHDPKAGYVTLMMHTFIGDNLSDVNKHVRRAFSTYLQSGGTDFLSGIGSSRGKKIDFSKLSKQDFDEYLKFVVDRLMTEKRVLFGTQQTCLETISRLKEIGVNEVACQLDFGVEADLILKNLPFLNELKERFNFEAPVEAVLQFQEVNTSKDSNSTVNSSSQQCSSLNGTVELVLEDQQLAQAKKENFSDWLYEVEWQPKTLLTQKLTHLPLNYGLIPPQYLHTGEEAKHRATTSSLLNQRGSWVIFADSKGVGQKLADQLRLYGNTCIMVLAGDSYECLGREQFKINPAQPEDFRRLFSEVLGTDWPPCVAVVHLWSLEAVVSEKMTLASLEAAQLMGTGSALYSIQALADRGGADLPRLWLVTMDAQPAGSKSVSLAVAQSSVWGLGRALFVEYPQLWGGLVDLDSRNQVDQTASELFDAIVNQDGEDQLAFRQGQCYVARLVRKPEFAEQILPFQRRLDGSYLVTGGLGGIGFQIASWLVKQGARHLILLGRTALPLRSSWSQIEEGSFLAAQIAAIRDMEAQGANVHVASVDVADEAQLTSFLNGFQSKGWPSIRGIVHTAGLWQDRSLPQLDQVALNAVFRPKGVGSWLLHSLFKDAELDFFVLCSSAASLMSTHGQGNYAAANAFLDALAHYRRSQGLPALSINWGPWSEVGFGTTSEGVRSHARLERNGIGRIAPKQGLEVMQSLLWQHSAQVAVMPINWLQLFSVDLAAAKSPLLSELARSVQPHKEVEQLSAQRSELLHQLQDASTSEAKDLLITHIRDRVAEILDLEPSQLNVNQSLTDFGIDSMMAVEMKNTFLVDLGVDLPIGKLLKGSSVAQLATQVFAQMKVASLTLSEYSLIKASDDREEIEV